MLSSNFFYLHHFIFVWQALAISKVLILMSFGVVYLVQIGLIPLTGGGHFLLKLREGHTSSLDVATSLLMDWLVLCFGWPEEEISIISWSNCVSFLVPFSF